jgi:hypothetical protein
MSELDAQTILNLTAVLAHNLLAAYDRRAALTDPDGTTLPVYEPQLAQQLVRALEPGVVAFVARLTANLPPDFDAGPVLARFWADPAAADALNQYGMDAPGGTRAAAEALLAAGWPGEWLEVGALEEALAAWAAASAEMARLDAAHLDTPNTTYEPDQQVSAGAPSPLHAEMAELVRALAADGLGLIDAGHVIAADGYTILFSWRRQSAGRDEVNEAHVVEETTAEPPALEPTASLPLPIDEPPNPPPPAPGPLPPPSLPSPSSSVDEVIPLRLDTAAPPQVTTGLPFDLAAAIRQATSPPLAPDDLTQHESAPFAAILPAGASFVSLRIQIAAPDCDIHGGDTRPVRLFPGQDGPAVYFQLTPRRAGPLSIIVTVYQETDWIGSTRLRTEAGAAVDAPRAGLVLNVVSQPLGETAVNRKALRDALDHAYSDAELRDLCFELEVEYEDLPGDGQAAKARELVTYCQRRGLLAALVACVMRDRPLLLGARG